MTWRELRCYVRQLPPTARTRVAAGDEDSIWGLQEHLTAVVIDELRTANWQRSQEGVPKGKQKPPPRPFPRPGMAKARQHDKNGPARQEARQRALRRAAERKRALAAGEIT